METKHNFQIGDDVQIMGKVIGLYNNGRIEVELPSHCVRLDGFQ